MGGIAYDTVMVKRIVIDTNVFISSLRSTRGASHELMMLAGKPELEFALSVPLVIEYEDVAKRMLSDIGLTASDIDDILDYLCSVAHLQEIHFLWRPFLKYSRDDHVLELAVEANCEAIVTHNIKDFAGCEQFGISVVGPREYLRGIGGTS